MRVNESKTQLLCLSTSIDNEVTSYIRTSTGQKIESGSSLKILGFCFDRCPGVECHVQDLERKIRKRTWIIRNLKKAGLSKKDMISCYFSLVHPVLDYATPVYHSMLNKNQSDRLEKLQRDVSKTIFTDSNDPTVKFLSLNPPSQIFPGIFPRKVQFTRLR